jgi:rhomboid protease GluP
VTFSTLLVLAVISAVVIRILTSEERERVLRLTLAVLREARDAALLRTPDLDLFGEALRARTPRAPVMPALVAMNAAVFLVVLLAGATGSLDALLGWGGNFGPRTTNGQWWRLVTSMFVHAGFFHLVINMVALVQAGLILERLVGPAAFAAVYVVSGVLAGLVTVTAFPIAISVGSSGAVFGIYGLLLAASAWGFFNRARVAIPPVAARSLAPAAVVFVLFNLGSGAMPVGADLAGLLVGFGCGLILTRAVTEGTPSPRWVAGQVAATVVIVVAAAVPLRGIVDVRPEIQQVITFEERTAAAYEEAAGRFRVGRIAPEDLAEVIDHAILPDLEELRDRIDALGKVPREQRPLVAAAQEYLRLRDESWRIRSEGGSERKSVNRRLPDADGKPSGIRPAGVRASKELYVHDRPALHHLGVRLDFYIAVRLRHARDVAGGLEGRHRHALHHAHGIELMPPRNGKNAGAKRQRNRLDDLGGKPRETTKSRGEEDVGVGQARRRIARHAENQLSLDAAEGCRLSRLHRDAVKEDLALRGDDVEDEIALADGASAREHEHVVFEAIAHRPREVLHGVRRGA